MSSAVATPQKGSTQQVGAKPTNVVDATISQRIAYLWSASQVAFTSNLPDLANYYLFTRYNTRDNLIKYSESQGFAVGADISLCTSCHSLLIPGATARVKLVPRQSLSDLNNTRMQDSADKSTSLALSGPKNRKNAKNALIYTCKRCGHTLVSMGTPTLHTEKKKSSPASLHPSTSKQIHSSSFKSDVKPKSNSEVPIKSQQKAIAKDIQAKDERQRLLAAMLKSSSKQPPKKNEIVASPKKGPTPAPAKTPKKSLFNFLNSL